jgi:hypothetical protein
VEDLDIAAQDYVGRNWHEDRCIRVVPLEGECRTRASSAASQNGANRTIQQNCASINCR